MPQESSNCEILERIKIICVSPVVVVRRSALLVLLCNICYHIFHLKFLMKSINFAHIGHGIESDLSYDNALVDIALI